MSGNKTVLYLCKDNSNKMIDKLFSMGYIPLIREKMFKALESLRHGDYQAVLIDARSSEVDMLEFILNVRDIDPNIPVLIIDRAENVFIDQAVVRLNNTFLMAPNPQRLAQTMQLLNRHMLIN